MLKQSLSGWKAQGYMSISADILKKIRELGYNLDDHVIEATRSLYEPLYKQMAEADAKNVIPHLGYQYGGLPLQTLDVYQPSQVLVNVRNPILIYIHGGGFNSGDKANYANLGNYFAKQGYLTIVANYRLAPEFVWPAGADDVAAIIAWAFKRAPDFNADRHNIFLMGHSAGASHVADYAIAKAAGELDANVRGIILVSGPSYDLTLLSDNHLYYGEAQKNPANSVINRLADFKLPLFLTYAEYEPRHIATQNYLFAKALNDRAVADLKQNADEPYFPVIKTIMRHNHVSIIKSLNTADENFGKDVVRFMRRYTVA